MFLKFKLKVQSEAEKRKVSRAAFYLSSYLLQVNSGIKSEAVKCWFKNISEGGFSLETDQGEMKSGDEIKVLYKIGSQMRNDNLRIQHSSRILNKFRYGCAFIDDDEKRSSAIYEYVMNNLKNES